VEAIVQASLDSVKIASTCRNIPQQCFRGVKEKSATEGDVCLLRVTTAGTDHPYLEHPNGRYQRLYADDIVIATLGTRHSTKWLSGTLPATGKVEFGTCLAQLSNSGVFGELLSASSEFNISPVRAKLLGVVTDPKGGELRLLDHAPAIGAKISLAGANMILVMGTSAEAGKSTAVAAVCQAAIRQGLHCGVAKMCGTSSVAELQTYKDSGAAFGVDCVDLGLPTTYALSPVAARKAALWLPSYLRQLGAGLIVCEFGGDILGGGASEMIRALRRKCAPSAVILAANDPFAAAYATASLRAEGVQVTLVCGRCSDSEPSRIRTQKLTGVPAMSLLSLDPSQMEQALLGETERRCKN
jgi:hypothetical protein